MKTSTLNHLAKLGANASAITFGLLLSSQSAFAFTVGYFTDFNETTTAPAAPITLAGYTPVQILDITTFNLSTVDALMVNEPSNGGISAGLLGRLGDIQTWVQGGGKFIVHDRFVTNDIGDPQSNPLLVGAPTTLLDRDFTISSDIDVVPPGTTLVTSGPFGTITNTSLDGGDATTHGFALLNTLPAGSTPILQIDGNANQIAAFSYGLGHGFVYYSTIPLDFYLEGFGPNPPRDNFNQIYTPNVLAYAESQAESQKVPEPASVLGLLAIGVLGAGSALKRKLK
jgi:hypothetical protein